MSTARTIRPGSSSCGRSEERCAASPVFTCCCFSRSRCHALRMRRQRTPSPRHRRSPRRRLPTHLAVCFEPAERQFQIGGRFTSVDGDPARFQRYQDLRDGLLFTDVRYAWAEPSGSWQARVAADNVGWRDQRYSGSYERTGRFVVSGLWDQIPQFYSVDTQTPYTSFNSPLPLDDATQRAIQNGQATLSAYLPLASQFDLRERRNIGTFSIVATPTPQFDVKAGFTTTQHEGELPWGASFGFSNDVEVALPYDSRTNDFNVGTEWTNGRQMLRVGYTGSWFNNLDDTLVWDSPLRLDDSTSAPGRGRMALWPSNSAQTISAAGYTKFAHRTQLTGFRLVRILEQRRAAATVHDQPDASADRTSAGERRGRGACLFDEPRARLASAECIAVHRPRAPLRLRESDPGDADPGVHQLRHLGKGVVHWRAGTVRAQPHELRCRRDLYRTVGAGADGGLYAQQQRPRLPHLREHGRERPAAVGRHGRLAVGHVPRSV